MKSALFVDFDNVFSQLRQLQPEAAERFARQPTEWLNWLIASLALPEPHEPGARRRLLVRRCYLNPNWYQNYRHAFLRAGFEIVDCPPVTQQGKTSTDIHMVLDIVELLQHETHYDEFIVFSADADFTPVLRKLRRYDRRTTVLAIGFPSAAYQASADLMIDERLFLREALGLGQPSAELEPVEAPAAEPSLPSAVVAAAAMVPVSAGVVPRPATPAELADIASRIWTTLEASPEPVSAGRLAAQLRLEHPAVVENWNGCGSFKGFFRSLGLSRVVWLSGSGGRLADATRHDLGEVMPEQEADSPWAGPDGSFALIREVCTLTGAPMLAPRHLRQVISTLAEELANAPFDLATTTQRVSDRCLDDLGLRVRRRDVTFIVRGMQLNGHVFGQGRDDTLTLTQRLLHQMLFLCEREQKLLTAGEAEQIAQWVGAADSLTR
ncbi:NYN domain-containing protein [Roseateles cellulosilyticus]|uniref:NYN domain-containing protein n=1 Tax=Pelomonas cellulosilytica TaxID=2906762 RepID=A0ABS8XX35_9BURK|nr:NYN domain-containing protein [Pelomonas sp. P8]MCE4555269.1 NYN domain-containing protein [Pelomonas sp. P8]